MNRACLESLHTNSEFKKIRLLPDTLTIETIDSFHSPTQLKHIVENKASDAATRAANLLLQDAPLTDKSFKMVSIIASSIGSSDLQYYFRAGRAYIEINHKLGLVGNMFFRAAFDDLFGIGKYHLVEQENSLCIICRA
ncbi:conserved hypothetical protein [Candidatus Nitrosotenuis uzonensis]|uniref:Uncharacterized protein n=1 Tax=Candidatus Nitrosotenuis uzonensis TaxID=1407055 RepID=A0A812F2L9_9ARCH|nr:conserved hypothetical protein [Candidatus Nitrosotenuis uzonensis]